MAETEEVIGEQSAGKNLCGRTIRANSLRPVPLLKSQRQENMVGLVSDQRSCLSISVAFLGVLAGLFAVPAGMRSQPPTEAV